MSNHVLEELTNALVNEGSLTVVARQNLTLLQQEMNFQLSGDVSDETAQAVGRMLGAEMVVTGTQGIAGSNYRFRFQVLEVETAAIRYSGALDVRNNSLVRNLMSSGVPSTNFTFGERAGTAVLNMAFGMGSFVIQKDPASGVLIAFLEGLGGGMMAASLLGLFNDRNNPYNENTQSRFGYDPYFHYGLAAYGGGVLVGVFKAVTYQKPFVTTSQTNYNPWTIALVPDRRGKAAVQLNYTFHF
jgi:hypothetical protein